MKKIIIIFTFLSVLVSCSTVYDDVQNENSITNNETVLSEEDEVIENSNESSENVDEETIENPTESSEDIIEDEITEDSNETIDTVEVVENPTESSNNIDEETVENSNETIITFIVNFDCNDGTSIPSQNIEINNKCSLPSNPTKDDYEFAYWYVDDDNVEFDFNTPITSDITLKAKWYKNWCEVDECDNLSDFDYYMNDDIKKCRITTIYNKYKYELGKNSCYFNVMKIDNKIKVEFYVGATNQKIIDVIKTENNIRFITCED